MKRAINFELLAQLAGSPRTDQAQESGSSGFHLIAECDIARLASERGNVSASDNARHSQVGEPDMGNGDPDNPPRRNPDDRDRADVIASIPEMPPCSWWVRVVLGNPDDLVSAEDAELALRLVKAHLEVAAGRQMFDATAAKVWNEKLASPKTVGELHEVIENLGPHAWSTFVHCWQTACGIQEPAKNEKSQPTGAPCPAAELPGKPDTPLPPLPVNAPVLEEGLHRALNGMPVKVQAFLLYSPKDPPAWRFYESPAERSQREQLESEGCWTG